MRKWKRAAAIALTAAMGMSTFAGCGQKEETKEEAKTEANAEETEENTSSEDAKDTETSSAKEYNGQDVSDKVELVMYVIGDEAEDEQKVLGKINEKLEEKINATLTVKHMSLSDYAQKYSLTIASGEAIDIIYASSWAGYTTEATKGAFAEVSDEVLEKYMPLTKENEPEIAFEQAQVGGKAYFVPANNAAVIGNTVLIRGDLREKYNIDKLENFDDLEKYYEAVAENEQGIFPYAASQNNEQMPVMMLDNNYNILGLNGTDDKLFYYRADEEAGADNVVWLYETDEYKEWAAKMKEWSDKGFWSKNAVANNTSPRDAFTNGTSASLIWNLGTCGAVASEVEKSHPDWKPEIYDFNLDKRKFLGSYTGDGAAVLASSKNQERAFMAIDLLKFDEECYNLVRLGIEGENWINPDGEADADTSHKTWRAGDRETAYPFGSALSWPFKNSMYERDREDKFVDEVELTKEWKAKQESVSLTGFTLDDSSIKNELSNLNNAKTKYVPLLDLGLIEDVDATLQEFNDQAEGAGLEKVIDAYKEQIEEYLKNKAE